MRLDRLLIYSFEVFLLMLILVACGGNALEPDEPHQNGPLRYIDIQLQSESVDGGYLAVRVYHPVAGISRYNDGAPILIWSDRGYDEGNLDNTLPDRADDFILIKFLYPGGSSNGRSSDGTYDYRGLSSIKALRDVILYSSGQLTDKNGKTLTDILPIPVLHENIGLLGEGFSGNTVIAVGAIFGDDLADYLKYIIQWETPVSSQSVTRELGRVKLDPDCVYMADFTNPFYISYTSLGMNINYNNLTFDPDGELYKVFHDGNGNGILDVIPYNHPTCPGLMTPDINANARIDSDEDFPLSTFPMENDMITYSRPVTYELWNRGLIDPWPDQLATPSQADSFWDLREAVRLYGELCNIIPHIEGMILTNIHDHSQAPKWRPHIHQAYDGFRLRGKWVKINPSPIYLHEANPNLTTRKDIPDLHPNTAPDDWTRPANYCIPIDIPREIYQLAAVWQMADRVQ